MTTNYDSEELAKFTTLAAHWWDPTGPLKTLHHINPIRLKQISEWMKLDGAHILDVGCGGGILAESLAKSGAKVTGIDMSASVIKVAKLHLLESGVEVHYFHQSVEALAHTSSQQFDAVTCLELLEHVPDPAAIIASCATLLKPNGHLFLSTINRRVKAYVQAILGAEYLLKLLPKNTHLYGKFIRPAEMCAWARAAHIRPKQLKGIAYNPFTQQCRITDDLSVNYLFHGVRCD